MSTCKTTGGHFHPEPSLRKLGKHDLHYTKEKKQRKKRNLIWWGQQIGQWPISHSGQVDQKLHKQKKNPNTLCHNGDYYLSFLKTIKQTRKTIAQISIHGPIFSPECTLHSADMTYSVMYFTHINVWQHIYMWAWAFWAYVPATSSTKRKFIIPSEG